MPGLLDFLTERHFFLRLGDSLTNRGHCRLHVERSCLFVAASRRQTQGRLGNKKTGLYVDRDLIANRQALLSLDSFERVFEFHWDR